MLPNLVDSHCHLPLIASPERPLESILSDAHAAGVGHVLCVSVDLETLPGVLATARLPGVFASVGVHPNTDADAREPSVDELVELAAAPGVVAIGETGLDYYRLEGSAEPQHARFRHHIRAARALGKPLIIHTRDSAADVLSVLREERASEVGGVMHCFVEDWDTASAAMDLGFMISLSGIVTFKSAQSLQAVAKRLPRESLLVETDAPWLAPVPFRGRQNEPAYVRHTAAFLARLREEDEAHLAATTTANFFRLFKGAVPAGPTPASHGG